MKTYEAEPGRHISYVAEKMLTLAIETGEQVVSTFNDVQLTCSPTTRPDWIEDEFWAAVRKDRPLHADPVAEKVADAIREDRRQLVWEREFPASPQPLPELLLRFGHDNYIRITSYGTATCCVLSRHEYQDVATREAPAAILAKLRQAVDDLAKIVEVGDDGPDVGEAEAERADTCRDARRAVDHGD